MCYVLTRMNQFFIVIIQQENEILDKCLLAMCLRNIKKQ